MPTTATSHRDWTTVEADEVAAEMRRRRDAGDEADAVAAWAREHAGWTAEDAADEVDVAWSEVA